MHFSSKNMRLSKKLDSLFF